MGLCATRVNLQVRHSMNTQKNDSNKNVVSLKLYSMPNANIDTDQIYPGRFLSLTSRAEMKKALFADAQNFPFLEDSEVPKVIVAGPQFGCGSSREHACWALADWGVKAIFAPSFGPIFRQNAIKNGILVSELSEKIIDSLAFFAGDELEIDFEANEILLLPVRIPFECDAFASKLALSDLDELGFLLSKRLDIMQFENRLLGDQT